MGCLYLEIEGQSWLVDSVVRGLMKIDQMGSWTKKRPEKNIESFFPHSDGAEFLSKQFQKSLETFRINHRPSIRTVFDAHFEYIAPYWYMLKNKRTQAALRGGAPRERLVVRGGPVVRAGRLMYA